MSKQTELYEQASQARHAGNTKLEAELLTQAQAMSHRDCYPEQYAHPMVGKMVEVVHKGNVVCCRHDRMHRGSDRGIPTGARRAHRTLPSPTLMDATMNWIYIKSEPQLFTVGFYSPDNKFHSDSDHGSREQAAERCHYLNGGTPRKEMQVLKEELTRLGMKVRA